MFSNSSSGGSFQKLGVSYVTGGHGPDSDTMGSMNTSSELPYDTKITALVTAASSAPDMSCNMAMFHPQWYETNNADYPADGGPGSTNIDKPGFSCMNPFLLAVNKSRQIWLLSKAS